MNNTFALEWPKASGTVRRYPETDHAAWTREPEARTKPARGQLPILDALIRRLRDGTELTATV